MVPWTVENLSRPSAQCKVPECEVPEYEVSDARSLAAMMRDVMVSICYTEGYAFSPKNIINVVADAPKQPSSHYYLCCHPTLVAEYNF